MDQNKYSKLGEQAGITREFQYEELKAATNNFNEAYKIGKGGSGEVFKGILNDKRHVAVKKVVDLNYGEQQFIAEVSAIAGVRHVNLVCLCGYCIYYMTEIDSFFCRCCFDSKEKQRVFYIVYDLSPNGSLDKWIFKSKEPHQSLSWNSRYIIAVDVANALIYLHHYCGSEARLHLDVKPANILLSKDFRGVLSDFGMSRLMKNNETTANTICKGTPGYIAPEWHFGVSIKCDIFSYGKVLMDLFFGQSYVCLDKNGEDIYRHPLQGGNSRSEHEIFYNFMQKELDRGTLMDYIDKSVLERRNEEVNTGEVNCLVRTALMCIKFDSKDRPHDMIEVLDILQGKNISGLSSSDVTSHIPSTPNEARLHASDLPLVPEHINVFASREATTKEVIQADKNSLSIIYNAEAGITPGLQNNYVIDSLSHTAIPLHNSSKTQQARSIAPAHPTVPNDFQSKKMTNKEVVQAENSSLKFIDTNEDRNIGPGQLIDEADSSSSCKQTNSVIASLSPTNVPPLISSAIQQEKSLAPTFPYLPERTDDFALREVTIQEVIQPEKNSLSLIDTTETDNRSSVQQNNFVIGSLSFADVTFEISSTTQLARSIAPALPTVPNNVLQVRNITNKEVVQTTNNPLSYIDTNEANNIDPIQPIDEAHSCSSCKQSNSVIASLSPTNVPPQISSAIPQESSIVPTLPTAPNDVLHLRNATSKEVFQTKNNPLSYIDTEEANNTSCKQTNSVIASLSPANVPPQISSAIQQERSLAPTFPYLPEHTNDFSLRVATIQEVNRPEKNSLSLIDTTGIGNNSSAQLNNFVIGSLFFADDPLEISSTAQPTRSHAPTLPFAPKLINDFAPRETAKKEEFFQAEKSLLSPIDTSEAGSNSSLETNSFVIDSFSSANTPSQVSSESQQSRSATPSLPLVPEHIDALASREAIKTEVQEEKSPISLINTIKNLLNRKKKNFYQRNEMLSKQMGGLLGQSSYCIFTVKELKRASKKFSEILERGGSGIVYKGILLDKRVVAIKKSKIVDETQIQSMLNEVVILSQATHPNVVKLLGCCLETEIPLLVFEYVPNGNLFQHIHENISGTSISWNDRMRIAAETATALQYLHSRPSMFIIHRDVKSPKILLDHNLTVKLSGFGISRLIQLDQNLISTPVQGTLGYLDPEYFHTGLFTTKSDVFSFGVVLVELLTGMKPISSKRSGEEISLANYFLASLKVDRLFQLVEPQIIKDGSHEQIIAYSDIAKRCLSWKGEDRPTMEEVAVKLKELIEPQDL